MNIPFNVAVDILKQALDFTGNVVGKFDEEKYVRAVNEIYGYAPDYSELDALYVLITNAADISTEDKKELLLAITNKKSELREKEFEYKQKAAQIVDRGLERKAETALKIISGVLIALSAGCAAYGATKGIYSNSSRLQIEPRIRR